MVTGLGTCRSANKLFRSIVRLPRERKAVARPIINSLFCRDRLPLTDTVCERAGKDAFWSPPTCVLSVTVLYVCHLFVWGSNIIIKFMIREFIIQCINFRHKEKKNKVFGYRKGCAVKIVCTFLLIYLREPDIEVIAAMRTFLDQFSGLLWLTLKWLITTGIRWPLRSTEFNVYCPHV